MKWLFAPEHARWLTLGTTIGWTLIKALLLLLVGLKVAGLLAKWTGKAMQRSHMEYTVAQFLERVFLTAMQIILLLTVVNLLGVPMTSMIAVLGAAGLAIGLALKDSLSNIASGVMLVALRPIRVNDIVTIHGVTGKVEMINIFQTRIRGADNQTITLPNSLITTDSIINLTPDTMRRIELVIGIGYDDDIDHARATALEVIHADSRVLADPEPSVLVYALGDNSVNLGIRCHTGNADYFQAKCELTENIKKAFDRAGISIPYPQRDVHINPGNGEPKQLAAPNGK